MKQKRIYLILFILSFILSVFLNFEKINIPHFHGLYKDVWVDVIYNENQDLKLIDIESYPINVLAVDKNHYLYKTSGFRKIKKINIKNPEKIKKIMVYVDNKIQFDNFDKIDNSKNIFNRLSIIALSFFYNFHLYIFSYIFLFLFLHNFKGRIDYYIYIGIIILISTILRLTQLNSIPFWDDEIYTLSVCAEYSPLSALFQDMGNPPLYFILFKIYKTIINYPQFYRISSVIGGVAFCITFYFYMKKLLGKRFGLIGLFFVSFNLTLIYFSQELRCYMLLMLLAVLSSIFMFKKNKTGYLISSICLLYTHFYGTFYFLYNFLFSLIYLKRKKRIEFLILNIISGLSFLPCLIFKIQGLNSDFNSWIEIPKIQDYMHLIKLFCGNIIILLIFLTVLVIVYKNCSKRKRIFINYNFFAILFVILISILFSYIVKPIFVPRYFYVVYPCYIALCCILTSNIKLNIIVFLLFIVQGYLGHQNLYCNHNLYLDFIRHDIDFKNKNYVFMTDTVNRYREFVFDGIKPIYVQVNMGINVINPDLYGIKKPCTCYVLNLYLEDETLEEAKNIELYKTPLGVFTKIEY